MKHPQPKKRRPPVDPKQPIEKPKLPGRPRKTTLDEAIAAASSWIPRNDSERAVWFVDHFKDELRYVDQWESWIGWSPKEGRWTREHRLEFEAARKMVTIFETQLRDGDLCSSSELEVQEALRRYIVSWGNDQKIRAMLNQAREMVAIRSKPTQFDANPWLLGVVNGTLDLESEDFYPTKDAVPEHFITRSMDVEYDKDATCPAFEKFQREIYIDEQGKPDEELIAWDQRLWGYALTGFTSEHVFPFHEGQGANGKSTKLGLKLKMFGSYGQQTQSRLVARDSRDNVETLLARMHGIRFAKTQEIQEGTYINSASIKDLTGGDTVVGRNLYEGHTEFDPTAKVHSFGNTLPRVREIDEGIWRRVRRIPYRARFQGESDDKQLRDKLWAERPGILNWMLCGLQEWKQRGLGTCEAVEVATKEYRDEEDELIGGFIEWRCVMAKEAEVKFNDLHTEFFDYCKYRERMSPSKIMTQTTFSRKIRKRSGITERRSGVRIWVGIGLRELSEIEQAEEADHIVAVETDAQHVPGRPEHLAKSSLF